MIYAGELSVRRLVEWAVQSTTNDKWYVSHTNWNDEVTYEVNIYDGTYFQFESLVTVPDVPNLTHVGNEQFSTPCDRLRSRHLGRFARTYLAPSTSSQM